MPYKTVRDLPPTVREHLPEHAQRIFRAAFNNALHEYGSEKRAFPVAWSAVKQEYHKDAEGKWVRDTPRSYQPVTSGSRAPHAQA